MLPLAILSAHPQETEPNISKKLVNDAAARFRVDPDATRAWLAATLARERAGESTYDALAGGYADAVATRYLPGSRCSKTRMLAAIEALESHPMDYRREQDGTVTRTVLLHGLIPTGGLTEPEAAVLASVCEGKLRPQWGLLEVVLFRARPTRPLTERDSIRLEHIAKRRLKVRLKAPGWPLVAILHALKSPFDLHFIGGI